MFKNENELIFESYVKSLDEAKGMDYSILDPIADEVYALLDPKRGGDEQQFEVALKTVHDAVANSKINPMSKAKMLHDVSTIATTGSPKDLMTYIANAQLAKKGLRVVKPYGVK